MTVKDRRLRLLVFNLCTDADDPVLGFTTAWLNALARRCASVDVVTMRAGRLALAENVCVYSVGKEKGYGEARRTLEFYRILFGLLLRRRYDACFAHMMPLFTVLGAPLLLLWQLPITLWYTHKAVSLKLRLAEKVAYRVVTASPKSFRLPSRKTRVIGHGVDTDVFIPAPRQRPPDQPFVVISVGRIAPVKSLETLIEAANSLYHASDFHNLRVSIVGEAAAQDAAYRAKLRQLVETLNLEAVVNFAGAVRHERVALEYQQADVMVNTSQTGSIDKAILEAMACGLPVITSNEAFREMLAPWGDALTIPHDSPAKLAANLLGLRQMTPDERRGLGLALREQVAQEHSLEHLADKLIAIFTTGELDVERP